MNSIVLFRGLFYHFLVSLLSRCSTRRVKSRHGPGVWCMVENGGIVQFLKGLPVLSTVSETRKFGKVWPTTTTTAIWPARLDWLMANNSKHSIFNIELPEFWDRTRNRHQLLYGKWKRVPVLFSLDFAVRNGDLIAKTANRTQHWDQTSSDRRSKPAGQKWWSGG